MDSDGYFWFVGRADDIIISSGFVHLPLLESSNLPGEISDLGWCSKTSFLLLGTVLGHLRLRVHWLSTQQLLNRPLSAVQTQSEER